MALLQIHSEVLVSGLKCVFHIRIVIPALLVSTIRGSTVIGFNSHHLYSTQGVSYLLLHTTVLL